MNENILKIGRADDNNVIIKHQKVGRYHCNIKQQTPEQYIIEDLESSNGTFVNNRKIKRALITTADVLQIADFKLDTELILAIFSRAKMPQALNYEQLLIEKNELIKLTKICDEFLKLKDIYENYQKDKKKILRGDTMKKTGIRAGLSLIPFVGIALSQLSGTVGVSIQEKIMELTEQFKTEYVCPNCFKFLGDEPWENMNKRGSCFYCKCKWK